MRTSRTATLSLAAALGLGSLIGLASPAAAETPELEPGIEIAVPGDTDPQPELPLADNPEEPECEPIACDLTDTPDEPECPPNPAVCDLTSNPADPGDDDSDGDAEVDGSVLDDSEESGAPTLPRTGAGTALLAALGVTLTGVGAGLRRIARR